jgi:hypothetical protein
MKFQFMFLLSNGNSEYHTFTASNLGDARQAAFTWSQSAFKANELLDFYYLA